MEDFPQLYNYSETKKGRKSETKSKPGLVKQISDRLSGGGVSKPEKKYSLKSYTGSSPAHEIREVRIAPGSYDPDLDESLNLDIEPVSLMNTARRNEAENKHNKLIKCAIFVFFLVVIALVVALATSVDDERKEKPQKNSNSAFSSSVDLSTFLEKVLPESTREEIAASISHSPRVEAYNWIKENEETLKGVYSSNGQLLQVFVLVTFYYSMNGAAWLSTTSPTDEKENNKWLTSEVHICQWHPKFPNTRPMCYQHGQTICNSFEDHKSCQLTQLSITENQLEGTIPSEIGLLTTLQRIDLTSNKIHGSIPAEIQHLKQLLTLSLDDNMLAHKIPKEIGNLSNLMLLSLAKNQLSGNMPTEIGNLKNLLQINLHRNSLHGSIITEIGKLTNLIELHIGENSLTSVIPAEIGRLHTTFKYIDISKNDISGTIPKVFGSLKQLEEIVAESCNFSGTIPTEVINLPNLKALRLPDNSLSGNFTPTTTKEHIYNSLEYLDVANNQLSGSLSEDINTILPNIEFLLLSNNSLTGTLPSSLSLLSNSLEVFSVSDNDLHGTIPTDFASLTSLKKLQLTNNQFTGDISHEICQLKQNHGVLVILDCEEVECRCGCTCA